VAASQPVEGVLPGVGAFDVPALSGRVGALSPVWAISPRMLRLSISARVALGRSRHPGAR